MHCCFPENEFGVSRLASVISRHVVAFLLCSWEMGASASPPWQCTTKKKKKTCNKRKTINISHTGKSDSPSLKEKNPNNARILKCKSR